MEKVLYILGELSDSDVDWLVQVGKKTPVNAGATLIQEGCPVDTLYVLLEGALVVTISALEGRQIAQLACGEVVGEMSFVDAYPPSATVRTLDDSLVLAIPRSALTEKLQSDEGFGCRFYRALAVLLSRRLRGTVQQLSEQNQASDSGVMSAEQVSIAQTRFERLISEPEFVET
ncbi:cyclic nucleotide-binding domain-containing protein [Vacuolonema iberomarrocanum]|uniref:cyclic nucleotide-binding domain-containing protein n=1 Tax=Vacuolonema iberomarrocanum TaxID=3454632 RepID=UPI0019FA3AE7|nr:cyclic nucleotide-binding domain-containing protein [filamentous cyanobacterium LEGE 07170]